MSAGLLFQAEAQAGNHLQSLVPGQVFRFQGGDDIACLCVTVVVENVRSRKWGLGHQSPDDVREKPLRTDDDVALHQRLTEGENSSIAAEVLESFVEEGDNCWSNLNLCLASQFDVWQHKLDELLLEYDRRRCRLLQRWQVLFDALADGRLPLGIAAVNELSMKSVQDLSKLDGQFVPGLSSVDEKWLTARKQEMVTERLLNVAVNADDSIFLPLRGFVSSGCYEQKRPWCSDGLISTGEERAPLERIVF